MTHDFRIGLIGLGRIGAFHAETLASLPGVSGLVVADADLARAEAVGAKFGAEVAASPDALLASRPDGVVIAAATDAHAALILAAVDAGIPTFCEKPTAATAAESLAVLAGTSGSGVPVQIGYQRRFDPGFVAARAAVASGELGWLHTVRSTTMDPVPPPPSYIATSGGIFRDCGVHDFDIIRWVTGREVVELVAIGANRGDKSFTAVGDVDTAAVTLTLDDGTLVIVSITRYNGRGYDCRLELHGSRDSVAAGWDDRLPMRSTEAGVEFPAGVPRQFFMDRFLPAYRAELSAFLDVVAGVRPSPCTLSDAIEAGWIAEAATLSAREHRAVRMEEVRR
ncbi:Gfo/Idh/MocA family oxidoreductase [Antrihabitans sp. YC2-6]|uniref:Gfo/Idh/MocA family protein n=1 Tax=Antrihabitans sp. YC2-6 TaxID=2799498 RepID=UPI0018F719F5|nr:Gfo/Idh/MocA family oxidoreductase [Antrihabitans sp. YC2-6]MBJ8344761.1 Gfo/Idh/MocA family oxidoreductase [Antrihabitans sp. YC2-6]